MRAIERIWYGGSPVAWLLLPFAALFWIVSGLRRAAYRVGVVATRRLPVPVIVVGNITVGGTGKTPLVVWLAAHLATRGWRPGVVSRGYGARAERPTPVDAASDPALAGDEPVLIARRAGCPVVVDRDRARGASWLCEHARCDLVIADDGLQHYRLARDLEIAVVDGARRFGNGMLLPAGPLREGRARLRSVDLVVTNGTPVAGEHGMSLVPGQLYALAEPARREPLATWRGRAVVAVAGIGNPERFFRTLEDAGLVVEGRGYPDHHRYDAADVAPPADGRPVLMTEKDAVKCGLFAGPSHWVLPVDAVPDPSFVARLDARLAEISHG
ncbi:MAG: tetraacyldisaccharide 4'-kinase [Gammaproteobacteria bacterium]|nr:tetraacyldisaccharide 4'-kinase [Gammaproteobacteria bacterium]